MLNFYRCIITDVYPEDKLCDCISEGGQRPFHKISWLAPMLSSGGGGIEVTPKRGDKCSVLSDGINEMVIGFRQDIVASPDQDVPREGSMGFSIKNEDGSTSQLLMHMGGAIILNSNKTVNMFLNPINSSIIANFFSLNMSSPAGYWRWDLDDQTGEVTYRKKTSTKTFPTNGNVSNGETTADETVELYLHIAPVRDKEIIIELKKMGNDKHGRLTVIINQWGAMTLNCDGVLNLQSNSMIKLDSPTVMINGRTVLRGSEPI